MLVWAVLLLLYMECMKNMLGILQSPTSLSNAINACCMHNKAAPPITCKVYCLPELVWCASNSLSEQQKVQNYAFRHIITISRSHLCTQ